jgi:hypothetical protein
MGTRLSMVVGPPLDSGMLCPHSKFQTLIVFEHHEVLHFALNISPYEVSQTCCLRAAGIFFLR